MSISKADDIAIALVARLAQISIANGYQTDVGLRIFRGKTAIDPSEAPCLTLIEAGDTPTSNDSGENVALDGEFAIEANITCDPNNPALAAHAAIADIKKALFAGDDLRLGGLAKSMRYLGRLMEPREPGTLVVGAAVRISVSWVEDLTAP